MSLHALSCWGDIIALGLGSGDIIILSATTGSQEAIFSGHTDPVGSIAFSLDGVLLVSGSMDKTAKLWDVQTGGIVKTFYGHTQGVNSVSISEDSTKIVSSSWDCKINLWDIQTGGCCYTVKQKWQIKYVTFFPNDSQHLMFVSDEKAQEWNMEDDHQVGEIKNVSHIAFSLDRAQFALCSEEKVIVQHLESISEFHVDEDAAYCCFSADSKLIAAAVGDIAYVWNITGSNDQPIEMFKGNDEIVALAFASPSCLISAFDNSVKFWQIGTSSTGFVELDQDLMPYTSISLQAKDNILITINKSGVSEFVPNHTRFHFEF